MRLILITFAATFLLTSQAAAQGLGPHYEEGWPVPMGGGDQTTGRLLIDRLEFATNEGDESLDYEVSGWYGGDWNRIWLEAEGEHDLHGSGRGEIERFDILGSHLIDPFWELRGGLGLQASYGPGSNNERGFAVIGIQGLAPYRFETDANLRVSDDGDVSADLELEYDMRLTQRLILQPKLETAIAFSDVPEFEQGSGINNIKTGLRLRYEIEREFAPYIGVSWDRKLGETEDIIKRDGGDTSNVSVLLGVRAWF